MVLFLFYGASAGLLLFCSMASPLFPIHNRVDQNTFMTVGKGMMDGLVPYRDLFEQKGPLLYFIHGLAYLLTGYNFTGVYLFEIVCIGSLLMIVHRIFRLYVKGETAALLLTMAAGAVILCTNCFLRGDNAEEFCLPLLAAGLYRLIVCSRDPGKKIPAYIWLLHGVMAGCVLWIKFTLLGFWIAFVLILGFRLLMKRALKALAAGYACFLAGMLVTSIPWVLYFYVNNAVYDFAYTYFYANIFLYSSGVPVFLKPLFPVGVSAVNLVFNPLLMVLIFLGLFRVVRPKPCLDLPRPERRAVWISFAGLYVGLYIGGRYYDYYLLIASVYALFGMVYLYRRYRPALVKKYRAVRRPLRIPAYLSGILVFCLIFSNCLPYYGQRRDETPQYRFAAIMADTPGATLLNYGFLDGGFYMASGTVPLTKYFCELNISYEEFPRMRDEQEALIAAGVPDYIVTRLRTRKDEPYQGSDALHQNYRLVDTAQNKPDRYFYYLFARNDIRE